MTREPKWVIVLEPRLVYYFFFFFFNENIFSTDALLKREGG